MLKDVMTMRHRKHPLCCSLFSITEPVVLALLPAPRRQRQAPGAGPERATCDCESSRAGRPGRWGRPRRRETRRDTVTVIRVSLKRKPQTSNMQLALSASRAPVARLGRPAVFGLCVHKSLPKNSLSRSLASESLTAGPPLQYRLNCGDLSSTDSHALDSRTPAVRHAQSV